MVVTYFAGAGQLDPPLRDRLVPLGRWAICSPKCNYDLRAFVDQWLAAALERLPQADARELVADFAGRLEARGRG